MKKVYGLIGTVILAFSLVACGNNQTSQQPVAENSGGTYGVQETKADGKTATVISDKQYSSMQKSEGFEFESNGDGTCSLKGIGTCKDKNIVIPEKSPAGETITTISEYAFYGVKDVENIIFADSKMELDEDAFQSCEFNNLIISGSQLVIGDSAFAYCDDIKSIMISGSSVDMDQYSFYDSGKDMDVQFLKSTVNLDKESMQSSKITKLLFSECTIEAKNSAFAYCEDITSIQINNCTAAIGKYAFYDCGDDMTLAITRCQLTLDEESFESCEVVSVAISDCKTDIGNSAFFYCDKLKNVSIGKGSLKVGEYAFYDCDDALAITYNGKTYNADEIEDVK